jgi:hypothetical protein
VTHHNNKWVRVMTVYTDEQALEDGTLIGLQSIELIGPDGRRPIDRISKAALDVLWTLHDGAGWDAREYLQNAYAVLMTIRGLAAAARDIAEEGEIKGRLFKTPTMRVFRELIGTEIEVPPMYLQVNERDAFTLMLTGDY